MSMEVAIVPEVITPEMINEAVAEVFAPLETPERAFELSSLEETSSITADNNEDDEQTIEVETAEEVSLKNGVYHEIKRKLHERFGIPLAEIAFAHDADTPAKKAELYKAVNAGRVRVLIGSTGKMGTGVNVQKRLVALHHLDQPWKPAELEQREGRILRQGNIYPEVFVFNYVTTKSFDGYMLQTLESKARFISQIMAGEVTARTAEDVGDMVLSVAQVKAIASGNPLVQRRIELEVKLVKLDRLRAAYYNNRARMREELKGLPIEIETKRAELVAHRKAIEARRPQTEDAYEIRLQQNIGNAPEDKTLLRLDKRERAGAHIRFLSELVIDRLRRNPAHRQIMEEIGSYRGFRIFVHTSGNARLAERSSLFNFQTELRLYPETTSEQDATSVFYTAQIGESNVGITQSIDWQLRHLEEKAEQTAAMITTLEARLESIGAEVERTWAHTREYRRLRRAYEAMGTQLQADGVAVEIITTFTGEAEDEGDVVDEGQDEQTTSANDETVTRQNPYTGLEEWNIIVEETLSEDDDDEAFERDGETASLFDSAFSNASNDDEDDIFAPSVQEETSLRDGSSDNGFGSSNTYHDEIFAGDELSNEFATAAAPSFVASSSTKRAKKEKRASKAAGVSNQSSLFG
jgi:hypothetical protein